MKRTHLINVKSNSYQSGLSEKVSRSLPRLGPADDPALVESLPIDAGTANDPISSLPHTTKKFVAVIDVIEGA